MNKYGIEEHVTRGTKIMSAWGELITAKDFKINIPAIFEIKEGVVVPNDVDVTASITVKTHTFKRIALNAVAAGSWEEMPPIPFITVYNPVFNGIGAPFITVLNTIYVNLPGELLFNLMKGEPMLHEFPLIVAGETIIGGAPVNKKQVQSLSI
ncbi:hypothetical protein KJ966_24585 [bacterium]|nr:hypothetical protein [bacterium]